MRHLSLALIPSLVALAFCSGVAAAPLQATTPQKAATPAKAAVPAKHKPRKIAKPAPVVKHAAGQFTILGVGIKACSSWTTARQANGTDQYILIGWMQGFITALNYDNSLNTGDLSNGFDADRLSAWVDTYCTTYPERNINAAVLALTYKLSSQNK